MEQTLVWLRFKPSSKREMYDIIWRNYLKYLVNDYLFKTLLRKSKLVNVNLYEILDFLRHLKCFVVENKDGSLIDIKTFKNWFYISGNCFLFLNHLKICVFTNYKEHFKKWNLKNSIAYILKKSIVFKITTME